jgi:hypothetical protein
MHGKGSLENIRNKKFWEELIAYFVSGKLLLVLASTIIHGSKSRGSDDHILLSHVVRVLFKKMVIIFLEPI